MKINCYNVISCLSIRKGDFMPILQLFIIFIVLVSLTYFVLKLLGYIIPVALWIVGFVIIAALIVVFTALFYSKIQDYFKDSLNK